jgi:hypothetical protein
METAEPRAKDRPREDQGPGPARTATGTLSGYDEEAPCLHDSAPRPAVHRRC